MRRCGLIANETATHQKSQMTWMEAAVSQSTILNKEPNPLCKNLL